MHSTGSAICRYADGLVGGREGTGNRRDAGIPRLHVRRAGVPRLHVGRDGRGPRLHTTGGGTVVRLRIGTCGGRPSLRSTVDVGVVRFPHAQSSAKGVVTLWLTRLRMLRLRSTVLVVDKTHDDVEESTEASLNEGNSALLNGTDPAVELNLVL